MKGPLQTLFRVRESGGVGGWLSCDRCGAGALSELLYAQYAIDATEAVSYCLERRSTGGEMPLDVLAFPDLSPPSGLPETGSRLKSVLEPGGALPSVFLSFGGGRESSRGGGAPLWSWYRAGAGGSLYERRVLGALLAFQRLRDFDAPGRPLLAGAGERGGVGGGGRALRGFLGKARGDGGARSPAACEVIEGSRARWFAYVGLFYEEEAEDGSFVVSAPDYHVMVPVLPGGRAEPAVAYGAVAATFCEHTAAPAGLRKEALQLDGPALHCALFAYSCLKAALADGGEARDGRGRVAVLEHTGSAPVLERGSGTVLADAYGLRLGLRRKGAEEEGVRPLLLSELDGRGKAETEGVDHAMGVCRELFQARRR